MLYKHLENAFATANNLLNDFLNHKPNIELAEKLSRKLADLFNDGGKILICGNGGSACDAMHFAEEFTGRYRKDRKALPVMAISDPGHLTCVANDFGFNQVFARTVSAFAHANDWLIVMSTSGNSANVIEAIKAAKHKKMTTFALLGKDGGKIAGSCDYELIVPATTADRIQEIHMLFLHVLIEGIERIMFPEHY